MKNVLIFGASMVQGVGGSSGSWAEKLKASFHRDMYGEDASGPVCEVYCLGVTGATSSDVLSRFEPEIVARLDRPGCTPEESCIVIQCGTNDSRATDTPDNFLTSIEDFTQNVHKLLDVAQKYAKHVVVVGMLPVDERKVRPKIHPYTGRASYFSNDRIKQFDDVWQAACKERQLDFVPLHSAVPEDWTERYLFTDGMHPDDKGYEWMRAHIEPVVRKHIGDLV